MTTQNSESTAVDLRDPLVIGEILLKGRRPGQRPSLHVVAETLPRYAIPDYAELPSGRDQHHSPEALPDA